MALSRLPPNVLQNIMALLDSHNKRSHLGQASKSFLENLTAFRIIQKTIPKMHRKGMTSDLFEELTEELSDKFFEAVPDSLIEITRFEKELHILDVSSYDEIHSRKIVVKRHRYFVEATYEVPIAESSRSKNEKHRLVFRVPDKYGNGIGLSYAMYTRDGDEDAWGSDTIDVEKQVESPCELVCLLLDLPWDPKTMHE